MASLNVDCVPHNHVKYKNLHLTQIMQSFCYYIRWIINKEHINFAIFWWIDFCSQVQPWKLSKKFDALNETMQMYYHHPDNLKKVSAIKSDQYCAIKHSDDIWYRLVMKTYVHGYI